MIKQYINLMKPGIIMGNMVSGLGGYFYATGGVILPDILFGVTLGLICIIGSACVFNNIYDADIDLLMSRTKNRAMVLSIFSKKHAIIFAIILSVLGFASLWILTSSTAFWLGLWAFFAYTVLYTVLTKRQSTWGTFVGSLSGAMPTVIGYTAVVNTINLQAILLFIIFVIWQMPHSYGIAFFRFEDYKRACINVLPVSKGLERTRAHIIIHITAFIIAIGVFGAMGYLHPIGLFSTLVVAMYWSFTAIFMYNTEGEERNKSLQQWGKRIFFISILMVIMLNLALAFNGVFDKI